MEPVRGALPTLVESSLDELRSLGLAQSMDIDAQPESDGPAVRCEAAWDEGGMAGVPATPFGIVEIKGTRFSFRTPKGELRQKRVRLCKFDDKCVRTARGASGLCIAHGGGKRCVFPGCTKGAENSGLVLHCKGHGGGKRCQRPQCPKAARAGTPFCIKHGGGKRCEKPGCVKAAIGATTLCVAHGGGKRCAYKDGCTKSTQGASVYCKRHARAAAVEAGKIELQCKVHKCNLEVRGGNDVCVLHASRGVCLLSSCDVATTRTSIFCQQHRRLDMLVAGGLVGEDRMRVLASWAIAERSRDEAATSFVEAVVESKTSPNQACAGNVVKRLVSCGKLANATVSSQNPLALLEAQLVRQQQQLEILRQHFEQKDAILTAFEGQELTHIREQQACLFREMDQSISETGALLREANKRRARGGGPARKRARQPPPTCTSPPVTKPVARASPAHVSDSNPSTDESTAI